MFAFSQQRTQNKTTVMSATIYDVARDANVSPKTAARILSGCSARKDNAARVMKAASRLGYVRNRAAASLRSGSSSYLGMIVPSLANPFYGYFAESFYTAACAKGLHLMTVTTGGRQEEENAGFNLFLQERVSAAIVNVSEGETDNWRTGVRKLLAARVPTIVCGASAASLGAHELRISDRRGIEQIVQHLVLNGHERIAFISGSEETLAQKERRKGFDEALHRNRLKTAKDWETSGDFSLESGRRQASHLLSLQNHPTALVCANDTLAFGAIRAAYLIGKRIPDEVAVTGFDGVPFSTFSNPELTTARQPMDAIATDVIQLLLKTDAPPTRLTYTTELVVRGSTVTM